MIKKILLSLFILCSHLYVSAQNTSGVIYLKNKWILKGTISYPADNTVAVVTGDRNTFVFNRSEIDSIVSIKNSSLHYGRFGHYTEIGALASSQNRPDNVTTAAFSFQTVNGYVFNRYLFTGIGVAADLYATQTIIPVFGSIRGDLTSSGVFVPYYFMDMGYGLNITSSTTEIDYKGGLMFASGLGFKIGLSNHAGFLVNFGYRLQKGATVTLGQKDNYSYNRIALRAGFYL